MNLQFSSKLTQSFFPLQLCVKFYSKSIWAFGFANKRCSLLDFLQSLFIDLLDFLISHSRFYVHFNISIMVFVIIILDSLVLLKLLHVKWRFYLLIVFLYLFDSLEFFVISSLHFEFSISSASLMQCYFYDI